MADEELELDVNQSKGSKTTMILLIVLIVLVLVMGGVGAWLFLGKDDSAGGASSSTAKAEKTLGPVTYQTLTPEFVVNFGPNSKARYLQVDLQVSSRDQDALKTMNTYRPIIRNDILVLLSGLTFEELSVRTGKESLQKKLLNTINKVVLSAANPAAADKDKNKGSNSKASTENEEMIEGPIENVYFTSFIMQ